MRKMKSTLLAGMLAAIACLSLGSCQSSSTPAVSTLDDNQLIGIIEDIPTVQAFLKDSIPGADLQRIINAGVNAPSALNKQPWHFTVITHSGTIEQLALAQKESMRNMKFPPMPKNAGKDAGEKPKIPTGNGPRAALGDSPVVVVVSCVPGSELDAGLACQNMSAMANLLGYGTKIASSVKMLFDGDRKDEYYAMLQVPEDQSVVMVLMIGKTNTEVYDAMTSATPRKPESQVVTLLR